MTEREFCYWLRSAFELSGAESFNKEQTRIIKEHLDLVLTKITPSLDYQKIYDGINNPTTTCTQLPVVYASCSESYPSAMEI